MWEEQLRRCLSSLVRVLDSRALLEVKLWATHVHLGVIVLEVVTEMFTWKLSSERTKHEKRRNIQELENLMAEYRRLRLQRRQSSQR